MVLIYLENVKANICRDITKYDVIFRMKKKFLFTNLALKLYDLYHFFRLVEKGLLTSFVS